MPKPMNGITHQRMGQGCSTISEAKVINLES